MASQSLEFLFHMQKGFFFIINENACFKKHHKQIWQNKFSQNWEVDILVKVILFFVF